MSPPAEAGSAVEPVASEATWDVFDQELRTDDDFELEIALEQAEPATYAEETGEEAGGDAEEEDVDVLRKYSDELDIEDFEGGPANTRKANRWGVNLYQGWQQHRHKDATLIEDLPLQVLAQRLPIFIIQVTIGLVCCL